MLLLLFIKNEWMNEWMNVQQYKDYHVNNSTLIYIYEYEPWF